MADNPQNKNWKENNDPEFEMPDPEQVEKDRQEAEKFYKSNDKDKEPAA